MPHLLLLPGLDGTGLLFQPFLAACPDGISAEVLPLPDAPLDYPALLAHFLPRLSENQPVTLLSESFSSPLALHLAAARPAAVRGVILAGGFVSSPVPWAPAWLPRLLPQSLLRQPPPALLEDALLGLHPPPGLRALLHQAASGVTPATLISRLRTVLRADARESLRAFPGPVHCLAGRHDRVVPARCLAEIRSLRPDATATVLDAPHLILQTRPGEAWEAVARFLQNA